MKVFILYAKENWITDVLVKEWIQNNKDIYTNNLDEADIVWILSNYIARRIPNYKYKTKKVITTIHHITPWKVDFVQKKHFDYLNEITDIFHTNSLKTTLEMKKYFNKPIKTIPLWHNEKLWTFLNKKTELRKKYNFDGFLIGSFQRDTEGASIKNGTFKPKLEKGPDIFIENIKSLQNIYNNIKVLLTGTRRQYIIKELKNNNIDYYYHQMCDLKTLNEFYNCLDLYIVSSRVEGGPRAINECSLTKTPLFSTNVGISNLLCYPESIFDIYEPSTILNCKTNIEYNFNNAQKYTIQNYMEKFTNLLFNK